MTRRVLNFVAVASLSISFLLAQPAGPPRTPPTPAEMSARHLSRLTTLLNLTTAQQADATTIFTNSQTVLSPVMANMKTARTALQAAVQKNDVGGIMNAATQIGSLTTQEVEVQAKAEAAFYALLTPDQKTKLNELHSSGFGGRGPGGPGHGGREHGPHP